MTLESHVTPPGSSPHEVEEGGVGMMGGDRNGLRKGWGGMTGTPRSQQLGSWAPRLNLVEMKQDVWTGETARCSLSLLHWR